MNSNYSNCLSTDSSRNDFWIKYGRSSAAKQPIWNTFLRAYCEMVTMWKACHWCNRHLCVRKLEILAVSDYLYGSALSDGTVFISSSELGLLFLAVEKWYRCRGNGNLRIASKEGNWWKIDWKLKHLHRNRFAFDLAVIWPSSLIFVVRLAHATQSGR